MYEFTDEKLATRDGFGKAIVKIGEDEQIVVMAASVGDSTRAYKFKDKFPDRYVEAGIAEQNMVGMAAGLALAGKIPFPTSFATFLPGRAYDHIRQSVGYSNLNVKVVSTHTGLTVGPDGATHQMMEDIAMMRATPNFTVIVPADARETEKATAAIAKMKGPVYMRLGREKIPVFTKEETPFEIGKAVELKPGNDITIIATGFMVYTALKAAEKLDLSVRVINMHTIKPIDKEAIIKAAKETRAIITAEEHQINGGLGGAVAEVLGENHPIRMKRFGMKNEWGESGKASELLKKYHLTEDDLAEEVLTLWNSLEQP